MDRTREARRSSTTMASSNGATKRRQIFSESGRGQVHPEVVTVRDRPEKKDRDPESLNRSKRRRSERFAPRNERDVEEYSSDESLGDDDVKHNNHRKSIRSSRIPRHAVADGMIGVPIPRKARSACIKRSHDCRTLSGSGGGEDRRRPPTSPGSYSFEVVSPSSVKQKKNVNGPKSRIPKPPKSSCTIEEDLEIEIAQVLSGLKKQPHSSKREDDSENSLKSSDVKGAKKLKVEGDDSSADLDCKARIETVHSVNIDESTNASKTSSVVLNIHNQKDEEARLDSAVSKEISEDPQLENNIDETSSSRKLEIDLMVPPTMPDRLSLLPSVSDSKDYCKQDCSVKSKEKIIVDKREWLNLDLESLSQEAGRDSSLRLQNLDWNQPQQAISAQQSSVLPLTVAFGGGPSRLPPQGYAPLIQNGKPVVDGSNGSNTLVQSAPFPASQRRPKRCATHCFIARNIQLHQDFVKTNHLPQPNQGSVYLDGGDLRPAAGNPPLVGSSPTLCLNSQAQDRIAANVSVPKDKASESGHFALTRPKKPQLPPSSNSIVPAQAFIFPTNHHLQPVIVPSKSPCPTKNPCVGVGTTSVSFNHLSSPASEASSPYFTVLPNNAYSPISGGSPSQALPFFSGSFYSPHMFQPPQLLQKQSQVQRETKASTCSSSSHRQPQPQVSVNSISSQAHVQKHRQQSQKSEAKAAGDSSDSRGSHTQKGGSYGQIMTAPMQPQKNSMSFASFAGGSAPANLNFSSSGYHFVSAPPVVHQKNHQASDSKTGGGSCSSSAEDPKKNLTGRPPAMNGQTLVFDNPSRTLNFVSGTWPPPAPTTVNGDPSVFTHHLTQRQQQSDRRKTTTRSQSDSVPALSSKWKNPETSSLTSCNSLNLKQFQSQQKIRTHGQIQISFAAPSKSQQGRSGAGSSSPHGKAANPKVNNSKALPLSPVPYSAVHPQDQTENSASGSTQKGSPVCGRNVPPIITSCPGPVSALKY